uniref:hypothetical protein n=1 Tax=Rhodoblastus sp. TaxID=1962975 RepID=UPI003F974E40
KANALAEPSIPLDFGFVLREILHCQTQKFPDRRIAHLSSKARPPGGFLLFAAWSSDLSVEAVRRGLLTRTRKLNGLPRRPLLRATRNNLPRLREDTSILIFWQKFLKNWRSRSYCHLESAHESPMLRNGAAVI